MTSTQLNKFKSLGILIAAAVCLVWFIGFKPHTRQPMSLVYMQSDFDFRECIANFEEAQKLGDVKAQKYWVERYNQ